MACCKRGLRCWIPRITIIRGRGKIDMAQEELELLVAPQAKREKFLSMSTPVMVTGPFDNFQIGIEPGGIFATAMKWWMSLIYVPFQVAHRRKISGRWRSHLLQCNGMGTYAGVTRILPAA